MQEPPTPTHRHSVLAIDDDVIVLRTLEGLLARDGLEVRTASSAESALAQLETDLPCVVLVDVMMPGMDGVTFCQRLKADPRTAHLPVVLVTGRTSPADVESGMHAGAVDYIKKPFDREEVQMRVRTQLRLHETQRARQRLDNHLAVISKAATDAIIIIDAAGAIAHWNEAAERMFGYSRDEAIGQTLHGLLAPERFHEAQRRAFPHFLATGEGAVVGRSLELTAVRRSGEEFPIELTLSSVKVDGAWCAVGFVRDITTRLQLEQSTRETGEFLRALLNAIPLPVFCKDIEGRFISVNHAFEQFYGAQEATLLGKSTHDIDPTALAELHREKDNRLLEEPGSIIYDTQLIDARGGTHDVEVHKATFTDGSGHVRGVIGAMRDLTDRRRMESELAHARKLEAVGQLAAGIAHEINTPAQYVGDSIRFLQEAFEGFGQILPLYRQAISTMKAAGCDQAILDTIVRAEDDLDIPYLEGHVPESLTRSLDGVARISTIVRAMKEFAHPDQREKTPADLNQAIRSTLVIARNEYKYVADVETDLGTLPPVVCHVGDINQVFLNLIVNAAHAISDVVAGTERRGQIQISTRAVGEAVRIELADTGGGIPESIQHRIFEPFFTTKEVGKGTGQGLAIARSVIVDKHGGNLTFHSVPGVGTTFVITLPVSGSGASRAEVLQ